jgi:hypothetical protein
MLIAADTVFGAIREGRCLRSRALLEPDEVLVSRSVFAALYSGGSDDGEKRYIASIFQSVGIILRDGTIDESVRAVLRRFIAFVIHQRTMACEWYVHLYLFHFWEECWRFSDERLVLSERYSEGQSDDSLTPFARKLLPKLGEANAYPDIVGLGGGYNRDLMIVEVKFDELDDRAVGQILRYYSIARSACDRVWHECDIRRIVPVLVVAKTRHAFWEAIPAYFREFLSIYSYRVEPESQRLLLTDARRALDTQTRELFSRISST